MRIKDTTIQTMNRLGKARIPFVFILDFNGQNNIVLPLEDIDPNWILYDFQGKTNSQKYTSSKVAQIKPEMISFENYQHKFNKVMQEIQLGNSYLTNLTICTPIQLNCQLVDVFYQAKAKYKVYLKDNFTCFSPEIFIQIKNNRIFSFPMKGTIDARIDNASQILLNDPKEMAEHYTIVDLIRNDLNIVGTQTKVDRFAYLDKIQTSKGPILQMSSQISADLPNTWNQNIGDIFQDLLPGGSITGSPKIKTLEIIEKSEAYNRNYYTGICGIFDGNTLDSGVMIRFIEQEQQQFFYKSGGGITALSIAQKEYQEIQQKIYIPI
ncbi:aminodeoxychorismate synthase component I [Myroides sp. LJL119]